VGSTDDTSTAGASQTETSSPESSSDASSGDVVDSTDTSSSGDAPAAWCLETSTIGAGAFEGLGERAQLADVDGDDRLELWTVVSTWNPLIEQMEATVTQHHVDATGLADVGDSHVWAGAVSRFADIDGDGSDDVVFVANDETSSTWIDISTGIPGEPQPLALPETSRDTWVDADGDGDVDLLVLAEYFDFEASRVQLWTNDGAGTFAITADLGDVFDGMLIETIEPVADGVFAAHASGSPLDFEYTSAMWEIRLVDGSQQTGAHTPVIAEGLAGASDFDGDDRVDFVTTGVQAPQDGTYLWHGSADGPVQRTLTGSMRTVEVGDFFGTGAPAVLVGDVGGHAELFDTPHDPTAPSVTLLGVLGDPGVGDTVVDIDGDGNDELLKETIKDDLYSYTIIEVRPCE